MSGLPESLGSILRCADEEERLWRLGVWSEPITITGDDLLRGQQTYDVCGFPRARPAARFSDIVGREPVLEMLRLEIAAAAEERRPIAHVVAYGPPGTGKTLLMEALAFEADCVAFPTTGPELATRADALRVLDGCERLHGAMGRPVALIIDELDGVTRQAAYVLHGPMVSGTLAWGGEIRRLPPITVLATVNSLARAPAALRSRFSERVYLGYVSEPELAEIARREAAKRGLALSEGVAEFVAGNSAGEPRKAGHLVRALRNVVRDGTAAAPEDARRALRLSGLAPAGLDDMQVRYLRYLAQAEGQTAGLVTLASVLSTDSREVSQAVEPFLLAARYVEVTRGGRMLTGKGIEYLEGTARGGGLRP